MKIDPAAKDSNATSGEEVIIVCAPPSVGSADAGARSSLEIGFKKAYSIASAGRAARLIAHGCTLPTSQPGWLNAHMNLSLSELGHYRLGDPIQQTRALSSSIRSWLDSIFAPAAGHRQASRIFYGSLAGRVLQPLFDAIPYAHGLAAAYPGGNFIITGDAWPGTHILRSLIEPTGGRVISPLPQRVRGWRLRFTLAFLFTFVRALIGQLKNYALSKKVRVFLTQHSSGDKPKPKIWLGLVPNWERVNRHVIDRIALPLLERKIPFGIVFITTLAMGERTQDRKEQKPTSDLPWPMLDFLKPHIKHIPLEQLVRPYSLLRFLSALRIGCVASLRIGWRLLQQGPYLAFGPYRAELDKLCRPISALATIDVLPVALANEAQSELSARYNFTDCKVVFSSVGVADSAAADHALRQSGATTINFVHGALGDGWYGQTENCADYMMVWTHTDVANCINQGTSAIFSPPDSSFVYRKISCRVRNILFLTNYLHNDWTAANYPLKPFLLEMLRAQKLIEQEHPGVFRFKWRPHPSDVRTEIDRVASQFPAFELSGQKSLDEDLLWADIAITSPSTAILNALAADLPVFVHCPPAQRILPEMQALADERKFFFANDLSSSFTDLVKALDKDRTTATAPERELYKTLVGLGETPKDINDLLQERLDTIRSNPTDIAYIHRRKH